MRLTKEKVTVPPNVFHFSFFLSVPSVFLRQGEVGIPGEQGELGYKGDKVDHRCIAYVHLINVHFLPSLAPALHAVSNTHIQCYAAFVTELCLCKNDLARCVLSSLWKFLCKPSSFVCVCVCKQHRTLFSTIMNRVASGDNRNTEQSHACLMSASFDKRPGFCFLASEHCPTVCLSFLCVVFVLDRASKVLQGYQASVGNQDHRLAQTLMSRNT